MSTIQDEQTRPLFRHPALRPLSREHMGALVVARLLERRGDAEARLAAAGAFACAWRADISAHFADEERILLPLGLPVELKLRLQSEHREIKALAERCAADAAQFASESGACEELGRLLRQHVRWEERVLFEAAQRVAGAALDGLTGRSREIERARPGSRAFERPAWAPRPAT